MILMSHYNCLSEIEIFIYKFILFQILLITTIHCSAATFFPFTSRSQPHAITYNIITGSRPDRHPAYSFDINRSPRFAPFAPYYAGSGRASAAAIHIQLTNTPHYTTTRNEYDGGLTMPINVHSPIGGAFSYGLLQPTAYNGLHGVPHLLAAPATAPTQYYHHRSPFPVLFE